MLLGLPGGGKTVILQRAAGFWAARESWPIPVLMDLGVFAQRMGGTGTLDTLLEIVAEDMPPDERPLLKEDLRNRLDDGRAMLLFDGLDESRELRPDVLRRIRALLQQIHPDVEIVLSTRDIAYADARSLGYPILRVHPPDHVTSTSEAILAEYATALSVSQSERGRWVKERARWVDQALEREPALKESPLMVVLLSLLAGERNDGALPRDRATVLREVVESVLRRWEVRPERFASIGGFTGEEANTLLHDGFNEIGSLLSASGNSSEEQVLSHVTNLLLSPRWRLREAQAESIARAILSFWDEAGIFISRGSPAVIEARVRLFAEVGAANTVVKLSEGERRTWMREAVDAVELQDTAILVATTDSAASDELIDVAVRRGSGRLLELTARVLRERVLVSEDQLRRLTKRLFGRMRLSTVRAWEATRLLADVPIPTDLREEALTHLVERVPSPHAEIGRALLLLKWGEKGERVEEAVLRVLEIEDIPPLERGPAPSRLRDRVLAARIDEGYVEAVLTGAPHVLDSHPHLAEPLMELAYSHLPASSSSKMAEILSEAGHIDVVQAHFARQAIGARDLSSWQKRFTTAYVHLLDSIKKLSTPGQLTPGQSRRLDELAGFIAALGVRGSTGDFEVAGQRSPTELSAVVDAYAELTGLDKGVLSAQAEILEEEWGDGSGMMDAILFVADMATESGLDWSNPAQPEEVRDRLITLVGEGAWQAHRAVDALVLYPQPEEVVARVEALLRDLPPLNRHVAAWLIGVIDSGYESRYRSWLASDDVVLRKSAGRLAATRFKLGEAISPLILISALDERDDVARYSILRALEGVRVSDEIQAAVQKARRRRATGWTCPVCDYHNEAGLENCSSCQYQAPHIAHVLHLPERPRPAFKI